MSDSKSLQDDEQINSLLHRALGTSKDHSEVDMRATDTQTVGADEQLDFLLRSATAVQQNVLPVDQIRNGASLDAAMWLGFEKPTKVQQVGLVLFGGFFVLTGLAYILTFHEHDHSFSLFDIIPAVFVLLGIKIASNAFRKRKRKVSE